ncbi:hypothetical protein EDB85DRAFT_1895170 [Lactarius pseudohatsudake]|nr:hypothetical protein EDB85DRAFT_1895170 [Lactarius pseudohatsudake]
MRRMRKARLFNKVSALSRFVQPVAPVRVGWVEGARNVPEAMKDVTTTTGSSQFAPQSSNLLFGYEWAPIVATPGGPWHLVDPVAFHPSSMSHSSQGQDPSQPDYYHPGNTYKSFPEYNQESRPHVHEQKQAHPSCEQVNIECRHCKCVVLGLYQFGKQRSYPIPYIQGVGRMTIPNCFSGSTQPALHLHWGGISSFASHEEFSQTDSEQPVTDYWQPESLFDEPPAPYPNNSCPPLSGVFLPDPVLSTDRRWNIDPMTSSPLAPLPLRHSSLYQVLKHELPAPPSIGTLHARMSSLAHALEPQDPQARQAALPCTPALGDRLGSFGVSAPSPNAASMSLSLGGWAGDPSSCSTLVQVPCLVVSAPTQTQGSVSSEALPTTCADAPPQNLSIVTPLHAHTPAHSFPEVATHNYDMLPRLCKLQPALPGSGKGDNSAASSPLSSMSSCPSSSAGALESSINDSKSALESIFTLPMLGRTGRRPVLRTKLACLFCRRRKIQCRPLVGDCQDNTCQQCAKRCRQCEYPEMTWRGQGRKRSHSDDLKESDCEEDSPPVTKEQRQT